MMASLFLLMSGAIAAVFFGKERHAVVFWLAALALCWLLFAYHATHKLAINW